MGAETARGAFEVAAPLASADVVLAEWGPKIMSAGAYRKVEKVHAKVATADGTLDTVVGNTCEASTPYVKGDVLMVGSRGGRYVCKPSEFKRRYDLDAPEPAGDTTLAAEGFALFAPLGVVWARPLSEEEVTAHFPDGGFTGHWGRSATVAPNDVLVVPYPDGGEIYVIPGPLFQKTYVPSPAHMHHCPASLVAHDAGGEATTTSAQPLELGSVPTAEPVATRVAVVARPLAAPGEEAGVRLDLQQERVDGLSASMNASLNEHSGEASMSQAWWCCRRACFDGSSELDLPSDDDEDDFVPIDVGCVVPSAWPQRKLQYKCENGSELAHRQSRYCFDEEDLDWKEDLAQCSTDDVVGWR